MENLALLDLSRVYESVKYPRRSSILFYFLFLYMFLNLMMLLELSRLGIIPSTNNHLKFSASFSPIIRDLDLLANIIRP